MDEEGKERGDVDMGAVFVCLFGDLGRTYGTEAAIEIYDIPVFHSLRALLEYTWSCEIIE